MKNTHPYFPTDLMSVGEAAAALGVHVDTVRRWEKDGRIKCVRTPTGHRRFHPEEVQALLENHTTRRLTA